MTGAAPAADDIAAAVAGQTVPERFLRTVRARAHEVALRWKDGDGWASWTWADYADRAARVAGALASGGVAPGSRVALMLRNRPEFHAADMGALLCGATPISVYNSSAPDQIAYLLAHAGATVAVVEADYLDRMLAARPSLPALAHVVVVGDGGGRAVPFDDLLAGAPVDLDAAAGVARPDDLATVIYTSGTTGPPKGVMLDHANVCWTVESLLRCMRWEPAGRRVLSYLPMAHVAERLVSHYQAAVLGYEVTTCPEPGQVGAYLPEVRPERLFAVPRVWEKLHARALALLEADRARQAPFDRAHAAGLDAALARAEAGGGAACDDDVLAPVRALLGLDALVFASSGAAPLPIETFRFFLGLGVPISEIYGLSETSGPMTWEPYRVRPGTVGPPIPGCEVRLDDDGEVLCRGGNVFRGYLDDPERTAEAFAPGGWLRTGDLGRFDEAGYLAIVDRKKELLVTAGGKNVSPANLEAALKAHPLVGQACVVGDRRPYVAALVVLDGEVAPAWAAARGIEGDLAALASHPDVVAEVQRAVDEANGRVSRAESIRRVAVLAREWRADSDELTPTMKLKRRVIEAKYAADIDALYR